MDRVMKNKQIFLVVALVYSAIVLLAACGSSKKANSIYTRADEMNEKLQELVNAGWQVHGSTRTLKGKLAEHYAKMDANSDLYEVIGTSTGCRSITVCRASAVNAACVEIAVKVGQDLVGKTIRDMKTDEGAEVPVEFNRFMEACKSKFETSIKGELEESLALIRSGRDGLNSYEIFFLVDKQSARKRRTQAIKDALEETKLDKEYARVVEKYVDDEVNL